MAGVYARGKWIRIEVRGRKWKVELKPTPENIRAMEKQRTALIHRLDAGEDFDDLIAETQGKQTSKAAKTLGYYAQHFLDIVAPERVSDSTLMGYESAYNAHWLPFDNRRIDLIQITELQRHLAAKDIHKKTRKNALSVLRMIYDCAVPEVFPTNPIDYWTIPRSKNDPAPEPDPYTLEERDELLAWLHQKCIIAWRYFTHGFGSGMRTGELLGAPWAHFEAPYMRVEQEMVRREIKPHTKTQRREVLLSSFVLDMLNDNPTRFKQGLIHLTPEGRMFKDADWLMEWWNRAHTATQVRRRTGPYPWRSTYISLLLGAGVNEYDVALMAGNSPAVIRKHYHKFIRKDRNEDKRQSQIEDALR